MYAFVGCNYIDTSCGVSFGLWYKNPLVKASDIETYVLCVT
jgi:hypothetical protein